MPPAPSRKYIPRAAEGSPSVTLRPSGEVAFEKEPSARGRRFVLHPGGVRALRAGGQPMARTVIRSPGTRSCGWPPDQARRSQSAGHGAPPWQWSGRNLFQSLTSPSTTSECERILHSGRNPYGEKGLRSSMALLLGNGVIGVKEVHAVHAAAIVRSTATTMSPQNQVEGYLCSPLELYRPAARTKRRHLCRTLAEGTLPGSHHRVEAAYALSGPDRALSIAASGPYPLLQDSIQSFRRKPPRGSNPYRSGDLSLGEETPAVDRMDPQDFRDFRWGQRPADDARLVLIGFAHAVGFTGQGCVGKGVLVG